MEPTLLPVHHHADGRRALTRYLNGEAARQVYVVDIRPSVTTAWHGHERQTDYWVVLEGVLQVGVMNFQRELETNAHYAERQIKELREFWLTAGYPQVLTIPPGFWHGYHNPGPGMCRLLNLTTEAYDPDKPDELRMEPDAIPGFEWGKVVMK